MEEIKIKEPKIKTVELSVKKTGDFTPPEVARKSNALARFLKGLFVNNWQIKIAAIVSAAVIWIVLIFV